MEKLTYENAIAELLATMESIQSHAADCGNMPDIPDEIAALFYDIVEDCGHAIAKAKGE